MSKNIKTCDPIPFPLRNGRLVIEVRNLPRDLTKHEAERIAAMIRSLVREGGGVKK